MTQPDSPSQPDTGGHAGPGAQPYDTPRPGMPAAQPDADREPTPITDSEPRPLPAPIAPQVTALTVAPRPVPASNSPLDGLEPIAEPIAKRKPAKPQPKRTPAKPQPALKPAPEAAPPAADAPEAAPAEAAPDPAPEQATPESEQAAPAQSITARMTGLGAHLMMLKPEVKRPVAKGWPLALAVSVEEADAHLAAGGNLGVNLSLSRFIVLDAEDYASTAAVTAAGFTLTVVPAKAQANYTHDPEHDKRGGSHTWLRVPDGIDASALPADQIGIKLACGGVIDVLAGVRYVVAPPSRLAEAPEFAYAPCQGGPLDPAVYVDRPEADFAEAPMWLFDKSAPCPPGLEPLHGCLAAKTAGERVEADAKSQELTDEVDAVPWDLWLDNDPRLTLTGEIDGCGCPIWHWAGAENSKSATLHEDCSQGSGAHIWSGSMIAELKLAGDHLSRLDLSAALAGLNRPEAAARVGITLGRGGGGELSAPSPDFLIDAASAREAEAAAATDPAEAARLTAIAGNLRAQAAAWDAKARAAAEARGEVFLSSSTTMIGGERPELDALVQQPAAGAPQTPQLQPGTPLIGSAGGSAAAASPLAAEAPPAPPPPAPAGEDESEQVEEARMRAREALLAASNPDLMDRIFGETELLQRMRAQARTQLISPFVVLMADATSVLSLIPPTTTLPPLLGRGPGSLNFISVVAGRSGAGKSTSGEPSFYVVSPGGCVSPLTPQVPSPRSVGSGEVIAAVFARIETDDDGNRGVVIHTESARLMWPEITKITAVRSRQGSTLSAELAQLWSGEILGSDTKTNTAYCLAHTYRATVTVGAQLATLAELYDPAAQLMGLAQRVWLVSAELADLPAEGSPEWDALIDAELDGPEAEPLEVPRFEPGRVPVDPAVRREIRLDRLRSSQLPETPELALETHMNMCRLKLAVAMAVRHGEPAAVTERWWRWTGHMLEHHRLVRRAGMLATKIKRATTAVDAGEGDAARAEARDAARWQTAVESTARWAARRARFTEAQAASGAHRGSYREERMPEILRELVAAGWLTTEAEAIPTAPGVVAVYYRPAPGMFAG